MFENHTTSTQPATKLGLDSGFLNRLANTAEFIRRKTKGFSASGFLLSCLKAVDTGKASYRQLAITLGQSQPTLLCRQALSYRCNAKAVGFLQGVATHLTSKLETTSEPKQFKRVLLQDSTQLWMHVGNVNHFRAVSNNAGPTSGAKLDFIEDLVSGGLLETEITEGCTQDRSLGPRLLGLIRPGDLVLRDMGYFDVKAFETIDSCQAHWISRLHAQAGVTLPCGKSLEKLLAHTTLNTIDLGEVSVTAKQYSCRLIAHRCPEPIAARRRAEKRHKRKLNKTNPTKQSLIREDWTIYLTNLPAGECEAEKIHRIYSQRWGIEIRFRALKSSTNMRKALNRTTNPYHLRILLLSMVIQSLLAALLHQRISRSKHRHAALATIELAANWLSQTLLVMRSVDEALPYDPRHLIPEKRKRKSRSAKLKPLF